jgi:hypothetical protein
MGKYHCTIDLLFDWFGLVYFENKKQKLSVVHTVDSKSVKQEVNGTVILPPLVFPAAGIQAVGWDFEYTLINQQNSSIFD